MWYMKPLQIITRTPGETKKLGELFAEEVGTFLQKTTPRRALVVGLVGDLAAGKTIFVQGMMKGFGVTGKITSPTFVLSKTYSVQKKNSAIRHICHCDFYRLSFQKEIKDIGLKEILTDPKTVVLVEWADRIPGFLKKGCLILLFKHMQKNHRAILFHQL
jgi:tRNA threonylcarbamoyladenosine biosynthesis protein TsaE